MQSIGPCRQDQLAYQFSGIFLFSGCNLQSKFAELADGLIYKLWLGRKLYIVVSSPELVKENIREQDLVFANRNPDIVCSDYGPYCPYWRTTHNLFVREVMSMRSLEACYGLRWPAVRKSVDEIYQAAGSSIDIGKLALRTMISLVITMLWGTSLGREKGDSVDSEFKTDMAKLMKLLAKPNILDFFPVLSTFDLQRVARHAREENLWFNRFLDSIIKSAEEGEERRSSGEANRDEQKNDLLQLLLELAVENEDGAPRTLSNQEIKGIVMDIVIEVTDTTATMVEEHYLTKLNYLEAVVMEASPPHFPWWYLVARTLLWSGYTIPKGSMFF